MKDISFQEKELKILREAVDEATSILGQKMAQSPDILSIIQILEEFIRTNKCLCYGGTAINNILPEQDRFYNRNIEIPDYDFFSPFALDYAKKLTKENDEIESMIIYLDDNDELKSFISEGFQENVF